MVLSIHDLSLSALKSDDEKLAKKSKETEALRDEIKTRMERLCFGLAMDYIDLVSSK